MRTLDLEEIKNIELNILKKFDCICKENNINYSLAYGSMLGAVRHKGFIPWDDDIDVFVLRSDYEKLLKLQYDDEHYKILSHRYSKDYYYPFAKMIDKSTLIIESWRAEKNMGVYIDIFPVDSFDYSSAEELSAILKKANSLSLKAFLLGHKISHHRKISVKYILKLILLVFTYPFKRQLISKIDKFASSLKGDRYCSMLMQGAEYEYVFDKNKLSKTILCSFEGNEFPIYEEYDYLLTKQYGDYMELPPVSQRVTNHYFKAYRKES